MNLAEVVDRLCSTRNPDLLRLVDHALPDDVDVQPQPDVVEPYRWFLARLGDGVPLTSAGYLPPAVVLDTMQTLGWDADWIGAGNREDLTGPVRDLRESARQLGLVRRYRGKLQPVAAARRLIDDPAALWTHLARRLPLGSTELEHQAGVLWLLGVAAGRAGDPALVGRGLAALGWVDRTTGRPPDAADVRALTGPTRMVFERLGLVASRRRTSDELVAASALARAALHADQPEPAPAPPERVPVRELTVTLAGVHPPVWRRIVVPESLTLRHLHGVLQTAMGWRGGHLHLFRVGAVVYGDVDDFPGRLGDEGTTTVGDIAARAREFDYEYDFGDGWEHRIQAGDRVVADDVPRCLDGARSCPPEDCGGVPGYERLLNALADPDHPDHAELTEWVGGQWDPEGFDAAAVTELLELLDRRALRR